MKWSLKIATIAGTEVKIHFTFFILLGIVAMGGHALDSLLFVSAAFLCVLLHEFGHVFAARGYGIKTPDITLLPIGGVARLERMPRVPLHELVVAVCGPLVNVMIAAAIAVVLRIPLDINPGYHFEQPGHFWEKLMIWNLWMVMFNLIPAFPMDGGRVLRALLAMVADYGRATRWAATIGQGLALSVAIYLVLSGEFREAPILLLVAFFIFMAAGQEAAMVTQEEATRGLRVRDAMLTDFHTVPPDATLRDVADLIISGSQHDFPILDEGGTMLGVITRKKLISALFEHPPGHPAVEIAVRCPETVPGLMNLGEALARLQASECPMLPVTDPVTGRLIGLLTSENVGEVLMVRAALRRAV